jgi:hypothetical protein
MPMHDWTAVGAGIFHAFHHEWISELCRTLNRELLPSEYYALPEQVAAGFGPDVLALQTGPDSPDDSPAGGTATKLQSRPQTRFTAETEVEFYRRKKSSVAVRHVSGDRIAAILEIVSPGNKSSRYAFRSFVDKACELLERRIHLLIIDPFPPGPRDPEGLHAAIWAEVEGVTFTPDPDRSLAALAYECDDLTRAYVETFAAGQPLPKMPLFLEPDGCVMVPLESTYRAAFDALPKRWQTVLSSSP